MANPAVVSCPQGVWTLVASNVTNGSIYNMTPTTEMMQTYRMHGQSAPSNDNDAVMAFNYPYDPLGISSSEGIDVYLKAVDGDGQVRVDL